MTVTRDTRLQLHEGIVPLVPCFGKVGLAYSGSMPVNFEKLLALDEVLDGQL